MQTRMVKQEIEEKFVTVHLQPVLVADVGEAGAKFDEGILQGALMGEFIERRRFEEVGSLMISRARSDCVGGKVSAKLVEALPARR